MLKKAILSLISLTFGFSLLFSGTTGKIAGKVINASTGEPLFAVNVIVEGTTLGAATDMQGNYVILNVPPGVYTVRASAVGFKTVRVTNVRVSVDQTTRVDFKLEEAAIELGEEVVVVAERPLVQRDLTSTSSKVSSDIIAKLPVENFTDIINLQAGVVEGHFRGGRIGEVAYMIDGIPVNDVFSNTYAIQVENHAIQEMEIVTGTFNAEYGQAMSGVVNIVTKEGGERYTGSFSVYTGDYVSSNRDLFMNIERVNPTDIYNFQGTLGGPVFKNKVNFFLSWRYYKNDGWIYGRRIFTPNRTSRILAPNQFNYQLKRCVRQNYTNIILNLSPINTTTCLRNIYPDRLTPYQIALLVIKVKIKIKLLIIIYGICVNPTRLNISTHHKLLPREYKRSPICAHVRTLPIYRT